ncbi:BamA/TamA family outer membrane protein [Aurantibacillus circumpalustris]|uniref:BamA/TamA family outer membrane protein n=1 Tax=Aurantibacillus circumpalustris TaxID=3036359 RepID=UPI00295C15FF|nr:BamA/TamA family outer membrane protein [Aurantibacillus circumpalustris]
MNFSPLWQILLCLLLVSKSFSQVDSNEVREDSVKNSGVPTYEEKDIIDIFKFKHAGGEGTGVKSTKPRITVVPFIGYTLQTRLAGIIAGNVAFYVDTLEETNQSAVSISCSYSQNNQIIAPLSSNIWTRKNKYNFLGNWRYYKYPEQTYGLGGNTDLKDRVGLDYTFFLFREAVLRHFEGSHVYAGLGYNLSHHTNIKQVTASPDTITDFDLYGRTETSTSSGISIHTLFDNRGNTINPKSGTYANLTYYNYSKLLGSNSNWQSVIVDLRKYFSLGKAKNVLSFWSYNWFTFGGKVPYLDLPSTGWDAYSNIGRGYIQSRLRGQNLLYLETEYRFKILRSGFLGGVLFANAQSVTDWPSNKFTAISPAAGFGLRIKLNKFSGTNLSIDYGFGTKGSQGLFINLGEVF